MQILNQRAHRSTTYFSQFILVNHKYNVYIVSFESTQDVIKTKRAQVQFAKMRMIWYGFIRELRYVYVYLRVSTGIKTKVCFFFEMKPNMGNGLIRCSVVDELGMLLDHFAYYVTQNIDRNSRQTCIQLKFQ